MKRSGGRRSDSSSQASGVETESPYANVADVRDGEGIRIRGYLDPEQALEEAGLAG